MSNVIEVTGKSIDEARKLAAEKLGVDQDSLKVEILEESKGKGLFGQSKVRIKAEAPVATAAPAPAAPVLADEPQAVVAVEEKQEEASKPAAKPSEKPKGRGKPRTEQPAVTESKEDAGEGEAQAVEVVATQEDAAKLLTTLEGLLSSADLNVTAKVSEVAGRYVTFELNGPDVSYLIGKHGEVLNAMQYLMNIISGRVLNNGVRTVIDGGDYRRKREEALTKMAQSIAAEVKSRGEEAVLDALPAFERRIVHKALGEIEGITTYSEGEEPNRRVVIAPAE